jgi:hypothetical protein
VIYQPEQAFVNQSDTLSDSAKIPHYTNDLMEVGGKRSFQDPLQHRLAFERQE